MNGDTLARSHFGDMPPRKRPHKGKKQVHRSERPRATSKRPQPTASVLAGDLAERGMFRVATTNFGGSGVRLVRAPIGPEFVSAIRLGYRHLFGRRATLGEILDRLRQYSLIEVLNDLARISALVYNSSAGDHDAQWSVCAGLMTRARAEEVQRALAPWRQVGQGANPRRRPIVLFDDVVVALAAKLAIRELPEDVQPTGANTTGLAEALLMLNDYVGDAAIDPSDAPMDTPDGAGSWAYFTFLAGSFGQTELPAQVFARSHDLYLTDRPHLRGHKDYLDLPDLAMRATGLPVDVLWAMLFALFSQYFKIDRETVASARGWVDLRLFFTTLGFSSEEIDRFFAATARSATELRQHISTRYPDEALHAFDVLPFAERPLVLIGDGAFCPLTRTLFAKITSGLYHVLLNGIPAGPGRNRFQQYVGVVFEDYVDQLVRRALGTQHPTLTYLGPAEIAAVVPLSRKATPKHVDGILLWEDTAVVFDSKARFLPADARGGRDRETFLDRVNDIYVGAARQVAQTIAHIRAGHFASSGIPASRVRRFYPVIISLSEFPIHPPLIRYVRAQVAGARVLQEQDVRPLEILIADEIECLETGISQGRSLAGLLEAKFASPAWRENAVHNYVVNTGAAGWPYRRSEYLGERFLRISDEAIALLRTRTGRTSPV